MRSGQQWLYWSFSHFFLPRKSFLRLSFWDGWRAEEEDEEEEEAETEFRHFTNQSADVFYLLYFIKRASFITLFLYLNGNYEGLLCEGVTLWPEAGVCPLLVRDTQQEMFSHLKSDMI